MDFDSPPPSLPSGLMGAYDQMETQWGSFVHAIGFFYHQLQRWGVEEVYAIQMAAWFQSHLSEMMQADANAEALETLVNRIQDKKKQGVSE